jgi:MFS transporter, OFA family, oxalate/formate antiporter
MEEAHGNRGWIVTFAGMGINLALGILYTWSIFKDAITASIERGGPGDFSWPLASVNDPYAVCCIVFAFSMILAGKCQDRFGPRVTAVAGGLLVGAGLIWISGTAGYWSWVMGFGVLVGAGIGFGYSAATPPALKWFPPRRTGLIAGLVVSGFGLASVYIAPLADYMVNTHGLQKAMLFFGAAFLLVVCSLSLWLVNPPEGYRPGSEGPGQSGAAVPPGNSGMSPGEILRTPEFYMIWFSYFIGAGAGLMVIGSVAGMARNAMGEAAFVVVAVLAIGNAGGRIIAGLVSDRIGRSLTLVIMLAAQAVLMFAAIPILRAENAALLTVLLATAIGFNYGTNLSLFPSFTKDLWGLKNFGLNYGIVFTAWGVGGLVLSRLSQMIKVATGSFDLCFVLSGVMLLGGALLAVVLGARLKRMTPSKEHKTLVNTLERRAAHEQCTEMV